MLRGLTRLRCISLFHNDDLYTEVELRLLYYKEMFVPLASKSPQKLVTDYRRLVQYAASQGSQKRASRVPIRTVGNLITPS